MMSPSMTDMWPCRYRDAQVTASTCDNLEKSACTAAGGCCWCESAAVGNACYTKVSPYLQLTLYFWVPLSTFDALIVSAQASNSTLFLLTISRAHPGGAMQDDAKRLPAAIFSCTNAAFNATSGPAS